MLTFDCHDCPATGHTETYWLRAAEKDTGNGERFIVAQKAFEQASRERGL